MNRPRRQPSTKLECYITILMIVVVAVFGFWIIGKDYSIEHGHMNFLERYVSLPGN